MAAQIIGSTIAGTISSATGFPNQSHLCWAENDAAWWVFYISSADTTHLKTFRSPDGVTWTAGASLTFGGAGTAGTDAAAFSVVYKNKASTDVFHIDYNHSADAAIYHCRATIAAGTITFGTDTLRVSAGVDIGTAASAWSSNDFLYAFSDEIGGNASSAKSTNADAGSSWTVGFGTDTQIGVSVVTNIGSTGALPTSTNRVLIVYDDGGDGLGYVKLNSRTWDGTTLGSELNITGAVTEQDVNDWCLCHVSDTDIHIVYATGTNTYSHKRWNGTDWTTVSGASIPNQTYKAVGSLALTTDGTSVWLAVIDSDTPNTVRYIKWTSNAWSGAWSALESTTKTRLFLSAYRQVLNSTAGFIWTQTNGVNFDIVFESLSTAAGYTTDMFPRIMGDLYPRAPRPRVDAY